MEKYYKPARRKTWAFFVTLLGVFLPASLRFRMDWPLAVAIVAVFLIYIGGISTEKIFLNMFEKKFGGKKQAR